MPSKHLIVFITNQIDRSQKLISERLAALAKTGKIPLKILSPLEGWVIPKNYTPSEIREVLVHAGFDTGSFTGTNLAERLAQEGFSVSLVTGWVKPEHEALGFPVINSRWLPEHIGNYSDFPLLFRQRLIAKPFLQDFFGNRGGDAELAAVKIQNNYSNKNGSNNSCYY